MVFSCRPLRRGRAGKCWSPVESLGLGEAPSLLGGDPTPSLPVVGAMTQWGPRDWEAAPQPSSCGCAHRPRSSWARAHVCFAKSKGFLCEGCGCLGHLRLTHLPWPRPQVTSCWFKSCLWENLGCGWWQRGHCPLPVRGGPCLLCPNWASSLPVSSRAGVGKGGCSPTGTPPALVSASGSESETWPLTSLFPPQTVVQLRLPHPTEK